MDPFDLSMGDPEVTERATKCWEALSAAVARAPEFAAHGYKPSAKTLKERTAHLLKRAVL